jgi:iron complex outermembrane recepter protein
VNDVLPQQRVWLPKRKMSRGDHKTGNANMRHAQNRDGKDATRSLLRAVLVACAGMAISAGAFAADSTSVPTGSATASTGGLDEVIVTATRRAESIESVPISIDAFGADQLAQGSIKGIEDIAALTPGLQFAMPNGFSSAFTTISIRGLNTNTGPPTVGLYLDDTVISSRLSGTANQGNVYPFVFDLNRVEVERGPQGTLFGAGAEAGTVRFITNQPSLTEYSGLARAELATTEGGRMSYETGAAFGGPIIQDELGFRLSVWDRSDGGWVNRIDPIPGPGYGTVVSPDANTNDKLVLKGALAFKVGDVLVTPALYYQRVHQDDAQRFYEAFSDPQNGIYNNGVLLPEVWTDKWVLPSIKVEDHLPFADLTANVSYLDRNATEILDESAFVCPGLQTPPGSGIQGCGNPLGTGYPSLASQVAYTPTNLSVNAYTGEVRLASNSTNSRVSWVAGIYYEHRVQRDFQTDYDQAAYPQYFGMPPPTNNLFSAIIQDQHELFEDVQTAIFAQADIRITDSLTVTLGERLAHVTVDGADTTSISALTGAPAYAAFHGSNNPTTPRVALSYKFDRDNLVYASFSEGYRPGGGNAEIPNTAGPCDGVPQVPSTYSPDTVHAFEVGAKDTILGGRFQANTSVFYNQWKNIQQYVSESCGPYAYGTNAGDAISDGVDLALRALLTQQLQFDVNVGYVNAYYSKSGYIPGLPESKATILVAEGDKVGILPQVNAPWNVNASLNYEIPLENGEKVHMQANTLYTSQNPGPFITQNTLVNGYPLAVPDPATHMYNARVGYTIHKLDLTFFMNNIFNNTPALSKYQANGSSNLISFTTFRPRTIGLTANLSF